MFTPPVLFLWWRHRDASDLLVTGVIASFGLGAWLARALVRAGRVGAGLAACAASLFGASLAILSVRPAMYPVLAVAGPALLAVSLPFLRARQLKIVGILAIALSAIITFAGAAATGALTGDGSSFAGDGIVAAAVLAESVLLVAVIWEFGTRFQQSLAESRRAADTLAAANARLRELDAVKTRFMNQAAHELNTPLTPIRIRLHLLKADPAVQSSADASRAIATIDRNVERVTRLVSDLLDATRLEAERLPLARKQFDLTDATREALEPFRAEAEAAGVALDWKPGPRLVVDADLARIEQVIHNLVQNAIKFTPAGGKVEIESGVENGEALVRVRDTGVGIPATDVEKLFRPFVQLPGAFGGTGLGLYISKGLVERHGGRISCASEGAGRGATFAFTLPLADA